MADKSTYEKLIETVNEITLIGEQKKLGRFYTEDDNLDGRIITVRGTPMINFGSCGYLGLETDARLKEAAIDAVKRFGTYFSCSRLYVSCGNYSELEELLAKMFNAHIVLTTNLSLGHHSVLPIVVGGKDMVIYDQQCHISMHELAYKLRHFGAEIGILRHNRLNELEEKIEENKSKFEKIWYVIDGVYSMFGDYPATKEIIKLLDKHKKLHLYVDDAHGMSWAGPNGTGYTMSQVELHPKMVLASSFAKGFGSCGGVFVFKDIELRDRVRRWGGPLTFSGPQEPATVAAAIASAKIHLSGEIYELQKKHQEKIQFCNQMMEKYRVPLIAYNNSPIFYIGLGLTKMGYNMLERLLNEGFNVNLGIFPAVPETCTGIRFTITNHILFEDIENLAKAIAYHLPLALKEEGRTMKDIYRAFRKYSDLEARFGPSELFFPVEESKKQDNLTISKYNSIKGLDKYEWNKLLGDRGSFDYNNLLLLEKVFSNSAEKENNWEFLYFQVKDDKGEVVVTTFFTIALCKDDMMASPEVSSLVEAQRIDNPYFLTSRYFMMGTQLTNGNHLYINREHPQWKEAMILLLDSVWEEHEKQKTNVLYYRDFMANDPEINLFFMEHGFIKIEIAENNVITDLRGLNIDTYLETKLKSKQRLQIKTEVTKDLDLFKFRLNDFSDEEIKTFYNFYLEISKKSLDLNTFTLPLKLFTEAAKTEGWEYFALEYMPENRVVSMGLCYKTENNYCPLIFGMDYSVDAGLNVYKKTLYHAINRGIDLHACNIYLGVTANKTKHKFGTTQFKQLGFVQIKDKYNMDYIDNLKFAAKK